MRRERRPEAEPDPADGAFGARPQGRSWAAPHPLLGSDLALRSLCDGVGAKAAGRTLRLGRPRIFVVQILSPDDRKESNMVSGKITSRFGRATVLAAAGFVLLATAAHAQESGGVLPPAARPHGYSLADMAATTAFFNTGPRVPGSEPDTPFQILFSPVDGPTPVFTVSPGTMFYVPVVYSDDSPPILGDFPDVTDQAAVAHYYFDSGELGAIFIEVEVDGQVSSLGPGYAVGAVAPLADGGSRYTTAAAFLSPLPKGSHTVKIRALLTGAALEPFFPGGVFAFETSYQVVVR
jgi:hypothetical protein